MSLVQFVLFGMLLLMVACTGQQPAGIKNSTIGSRPVKAACNGLTFEGQVFTKKNILSILGCTGWDKQYPRLMDGIKNANEADTNSALKVFNDSFTATKTQRKEFFKFLVAAHQSGQMTEVSHLLEKSIGDHKLMQQLTKFLSNQILDEQKRSALMKVLSLSNLENLKVVTAGKNLLRAYEGQEATLGQIFADEDEVRLRKKIVSIIDELATSMANKDWHQLANLIQNKDSALQKWALRGQVADGRPLLDILEHPTFVEDLAFLHKALEQGITCGNRSDQNDFKVNVAQEMKHKIEVLANGSREELERTLTHGLTKFIAFNGFCEEAQANQGLLSFHKVLTHAFAVTGSETDYLFLRDMHREFGDDRYKLISFLTSKTFVALRDELVRLRDKGFDEDFVRSLFSLLAGLTEADLDAISGLTKSFGTFDSQANLWMNAWAELWRGLSYEDRDDFIHLLSRLLKQDLNLAQVMAALENLLRTFPDFSQRLATNLAENDYQSHLRYIIFVLADPGVQEELAHFLSGDGLFEFLEILTREGRRTTLPAVELLPELPPVIYVQPQSPTREAELTRSCFEILSRGYQNNVNYYSIVNQLPDQCLATLGKVGFVGQIYLWMNSSHNYFEERYAVTDFHSGTGVWSPGMLQFIFTAAVKADQTVVSGSGARGIRNNIEEIHRVLTHPTLLETFNRFSSLYGTIHSQHNFDQQLLNFVEMRTDAQLNALAQDALALAYKAPARVELEIKPEPCTALSPDFGADPCLDSTKTTEHVLNIVRILKRKNEKDQSLLERVLQWIHPDGGIDLPFRKRKAFTHQTSLDEVIRFLGDLSSEKTLRPFTMHSARGSKQMKGTVTDRLEVVIRDIGFVNNFYGAYFKNTIAGAETYREEVIKSETLLKLLAASGGAFRGTNTLPDSSKILLKNIKETYSSLVELDNKYLQADGSFRSYGTFIQSLLAIIGESSKLKTQHFNAYRVPKAEIVEGHNGLFLTEVVRMSGLRHLGSFVRNRFGEDLQALNSADFKLINSRLLNRHELPKLKQSLQALLEKYLDNDRNQLNQLITDVVAFSQGLKSEEQEVFEEISVKLLLLLSSSELSNDSIGDLADIFETVIVAWPELRGVILEVGHKEKFLKSLNEILDQLVARPEKLERVLKQLLSSNLITRADFLKLVSNSDVRRQLIDFLTFALDAEGVESTLNWADVLEAILGREGAEWEALKTWFKSALGGERDKLTLSLLIEFLGEKDVEGYRLKRMMDELFLNHRDSLLQFLDETFPSLQVRNKSH